MKQHEENAGKLILHKQNVKDFPNKMRNETNIKCSSSKKN